MSRPVLKYASFVIVVVTYGSTILDIVHFEQLGSLFWISSLVLLLLGVICHKDKEWHKKVHPIDLISTIYVILRFREKYRLRFLFRPSTDYWTERSLAFCRFTEAVVYFLGAALVIAVILNAVTSSYGWGLTRIAKSVCYRVYYSFLYRALRNKLCFRYFKHVVLKKKMLTVAECELFRQAVETRPEYIKDKFFEKSYYPIVFRKHAEKKSFMPKWLYNISLVPGDKIKLSCSNPKEKSRKAEFLVNLTGSNLAIINNSGKRFLRDYYKHKNSREAITSHNKEINEFLSDRNTEKDSVEFYDGCFYRWGSAGTLPIINWRNEKWIAFVYRDIYPKGWNLPLGASECELEKGRPGITAIREMLEELIVVKDSNIREYDTSGQKGFPKRKELYHPLLNSIEGETNFRATKRRFYAKQKEIIDHTCQIEFGDEENSGDNSLECTDWRTTMRIRVNEDNRKVILPKNVSTNCMITVDNFEQGIECVKPVTFTMEDKNVLRMGEVDLLKETWINNPVILIKYSALEQYFGKSAEFQQLLDGGTLYSQNDEDFGEGLCMKSILNDPKNYHLFGVDMKDRDKYQKFLAEEIKKFKTTIGREYKQFQAQNMYLSNFVQRNKEYFGTQDGKKTIIADLGQEAENPAHYLCPAAWKSCYYLFRDIYKGEELQAIGE